MSTARVIGSRAGGGSIAVGAAGVLLGGGRSSVSGLKVTVFGSTGFLGNYVVDAFGKCGSQVCVPFRGDDMEVRHLKVMGDLGQIHPVPYDVRVPEAVAYCMRGADVVVNLVGRDFETENFSFDAVNVDSARNIAAAASEQGVARLIHVSALGADAESESAWARSKAAGEAAVREAYPTATILRPADVFGAQDKFSNALAQLAKSPLPRHPLLDGGVALRQPVFALDVARAIFAVAQSDSTEHEGGTYELAGPQQFSMLDLFEYICEQISVQPKVVSVPDILLDIVGGFSSAAPRLVTPMLSKDLVRRLGVDNVADASSELGGLEALGITPTPFEKVCTGWLHSYRSGGHFLSVNVGEA